jgi:hypothetical protein
MGFNHNTPASFSARPDKTSRGKEMLIADVHILWPLRSNSGRDDIFLVYMFSDILPLDNLKIMILYSMITWDPFGTGK